ncbi:pre-mRNA processing factor 3-domain-containing protein [Neohortaea acidophila]|uniref:Pre-mRNA processing factor 3-domain-containing protein n=1 Tax=Neohortaea acidophila TaxID=245834 RepID=A0A6A6Q4V3_9PEZI|nr:pre-mRNA processing factor 3-domain-containing protein [Neohortaea acidophila]KAF2487059.1 pre-mRNA processing factor 3-domain-containing protein [Neohortaea acidophila]
MSGKRALDADSPSGDSKRIRSNNGSPAPTAPPTMGNGETDAERKKRELAERMAAIRARQAAMKSSGPGEAPTPTSVVSPSPAPAPSTNGTSELERKKMEAQRKIAEMKARMAAQRGQVGSTASPINGAASAPPPPPQQPSEREARIAEARARAAELSKQKIAATTSAAPPPPPPRQDGRGARGGLGIGLHPSLIGDLTGTTSTKGKGPTGPKFSTTKGNQQPEAPPFNPYLPAEDEAAAGGERAHDGSYDSTLVAKKGGDRKSKQLVFNQKGKFMAQANALRQQARLEDMKRRIAAETRKVEIEEAGDKAFLVPAPPNVEWWDEGLLPEGQGSYENCLEAGRNKIATPDSIITALIQRPVLLQAPQDKFIPEAKPLMLTTQEQKKIRRIRRMADRKEVQAKIRLGLIDPPAPKVKKSNMMTVLGEQAVKDPTAVEARVNREIEQRANEHAQANEDRKLTQEQREEKLKSKQAGDDAKGIKIAIFRVDNLSSGRHRYQVDQNAKQNNLTGIVVLNPEMNLVIVEGGAHSITSYKKLMLNRIKWTENSMPLPDSKPTTFTSHTERAPGATESTTTKAAVWCNPLNELGELKDLSGNKCTLVWEGEEQARIFRKWNSRACETDGEARDLLSRQKMENMWTLARSK